LAQRWRDKLRSVKTLKVPKDLGKQAVPEQKALEEMAEEKRLQGRQQTELRASSQAVYIGTGL
jgi:hypothetical protein